MTPRNQFFPYESRAQIAVEDKRIRELVNRLLALGLIHNEILQR